MHIVKINGGLGNQMFQYAFALALERRFGGVKLDLAWIRAESAHNGYELDRHFRLRLPVCDEAEREALGDVDPSRIGRARRRLGLAKRSQYTARTAGWDPRSLELRRDTYFSGYWQSYKYYEGIEGYIRGAFDFIEPLSEANRAFIDSTAGRTLVGIHVRRGDYLTSSDYYSVCGLDYYRAAMAAASAGARDPLFLFFSDDLEWCKDNLRAPGESVYVDWNRGEASWADMRLMKACGALVVANSSFSWWGAWLGERGGRRVLAPSRWFLGRTRDNPNIVPPTWERIGSA